jgi:hypothetical protein
MTHTPEPWEVREVDGLVAIAHSGGFVLEADDDRQNIVDARRICACVNACRRIETSVLESDGYSIKAKLDSLDEQINGRMKAEQHRLDLLETLWEIVAGREGGEWLVLVNVDEIRKTINQIEADK